MINVPVLVSLILLSIAIVHVLWAIGFWWPIRDEEKLVRAVAGAKGGTKMPGAAASATVAMALISLVWWIWYGGQFGTQIHVTVLWGAMAIFAVRGIVPWMEFWRKKWPEEPFATLDKKYYGPLCIVIALALRITMRDLV